LNQDTQNIDRHIEFVTIPSGEFEMGCTNGQLGMCGDGEKPSHLVTISNSILVAKVETTQSLYLEFMGENPSLNIGCDECPVENVSWDNAVSFCNNLSTIYSLPNCYNCDSTGCSRVEDFINCRGYRLPTEAEWEYIARCDTDLVYSGDNDAFLVAWTKASSGDTTHSVAQLKPNDCGLYDLSGNVWEWVEGMYSPYPDDAVQDPIGNGSTRVVRGGSYDVFPIYSRVSNRRDFIDEREGNVGFRVVRTALD